MEQRDLYKEELEGFKRNYKKGLLRVKDKGIEYMKTENKRILETLKGNLNEKVKRLVESVREYCLE